MSLKKAVDLTSVVLAETVCQTARAQRSTVRLADGSVVELDADSRLTARLVAEFNRHSTEEIIVDDPALRRLRISGQFKSGDAARFIRHLSLAHPVNAEGVGPSKIRIVAR